MGRHSKFKAAQSAGKSSKGCLIIAAVPIVLLVGLMATVMLSGRGPGSEYAKRAAREQRQRDEAVADIVRNAGGEYDAGLGVSVITLPASQAMVITPREATELALTTYQRTGGAVRVQTPAGQVLAEAP